MKTRLLLCALAALSFAACAHIMVSGRKPAPIDTPTGPCRDEENLVNGKCLTRMPGQ